MPSNPNLVRVIRCYEPDRERYIQALLFFLAYIPQDMQASETPKAPEETPGALNSVTMTSRDLDKQDNADGSTKRV
jgi:hypothetical protein